MSDRERAQIAIGRKLRKDEHVHHHSLTQLVICSAEYHRWLHTVMRARNIPAPKRGGSTVLHLRFPTTTVAAIQERADEEDRTFSNMLTVLLKRGLKLTNEAQ